MTEPDHFRTLIGAYVTASLDPEERADLEQHLRGCVGCREELALLAPLPAILRRLPPPSWRHSFDAAIPEVTGAHRRTEHARLAAAAASAVRRRRRRRRGARAALAAAAAVAAAVLALLVLPAHSVAPARVMALRGVAATGTAQLEAKAWGTQIVLTADQLPRDALLTAVAYGPGGELTVGSWSSPPNGRAIVELATNLGPRSIKRLVVFRSGTSRVILQSATGGS